jgi:hypothetical protein
MVVQHKPWKTTPFEIIAYCPRSAFPKAQRREAQQRFSRHCLEKRKGENDRICTMVSNRSLLMMVNG